MFGEVSSATFSLCRWHFHSAWADVVNDVMGRTSIDGASNTVRCSEHFLYGAFQLASHRTGTHHFGNAEHVVECNVAVVFDVLHLLSVAWRLLQGLDNERSGRWNNWNCRLTILDGEADCDFQALPVTGCLGDIVTNLLWWETEWTDLWRKWWGCTDFTADAAEVD